MAKLTGPMLSFGARGQIGKTLVASKWKGIPYARQYVIPANPNTTRQQEVRATFALLREMWKIAPAEIPETWNAFAVGRPFTGMNKFVGENVRVLNNQSLMTAFIGSPGSRGGLPPIGMSATTGSSAGEVDIALTNPAAPSGWTLTAAQAVGFTDQDPTGYFTGPFVGETETVDPTAITLTDLEAGESCIVAAWLKWTKPDGRFAYSVGLTDTVTSGA